MDEFYRDQSSSYPGNLPIRVYSCTIAFDYILKWTIFWSRSRRSGAIAKDPETKTDDLSSQSRRSLQIQAKKIVDLNNDRLLSVKMSFIIGSSAFAQKISRLKRSPTFAPENLESRSSAFVLIVREPNSYNVVRPPSQAFTNKIILTPASKD